MTWHNGGTPKVKKVETSRLPRKRKEEVEKEVERGSATNRAAGPNESDGLEEEMLGKPQTRHE